MRWVCRLKPLLLVRWLRPGYVRWVPGTSPSFDGRVPRARTRSTWDDSDTWNAPRGYRPSRAEDVSSFVRCTLRLFPGVSRSFPVFPAAFTVFDGRMRCYLQTQHGRRR